MSQKEEKQRNIHLTKHGYPGICEYCSNWVVNPINHSSAGCTIEYTELIVCSRCKFPTEIDRISTGFHDHNPNSRNFCIFDEDEKKRLDEWHAHLAKSLIENFPHKILCLGCNNCLVCNPDYSDEVDRGYCSECWANR